MKSNLEFIVWEHNEKMFGEFLNKPEPLLHVGKLQDSETNAIEGIYFEWKIYLETVKGLFLNCIAEDKYYKNEIEDFSMKTIKAVAENSLYTFKIQFEDRMDLIRHRAEIDFRLSQAMLTQIINELYQ